MAGFLKAIARQGAVGNTARWAAHLYHRWVRLTPEDPLAMDSILATLIAARYQVDALVRPGGRSQCIGAALGTLHEAGRIRGICHVVVLVLTAEGDFADNHAGVNTAFIEVIGSELTSMGVPAEHAFGKDVHLCSENLCAVYLPSIRLLRLLLRA